MPTTASSRGVPEEPYWQERKMPAAVTENSGRIRVEFSMRWYMRLPSLPLIAVGLLFLVAAARSSGWTCPVTGAGATIGWGS
jgi:hypothetical protein